MATLYALRFHYADKLTDPLAFGVVGIPKAKKLAASFLGRTSPESITITAGHFPKPGEWIDYTDPLTHVVHGVIVNGKIVWPSPAPKMDGGDQLSFDDLTADHAA